MAISLIFLLVLALAGAMAYQMTSSELQIAGNYASSKEAFYAASAGVEEARDRLALVRTDPNVIYDPATSPNTAWTAFILATQWQPSDDADYSASDTNYFPSSGSQTNTSITANSLQSDLEYWVKVRHKTEGGNIVYYGYQNPFSSLTLAPFSSSTATEFRPVEIITAHGVGKKGRSTIRVEAAHDPGPPILAALYGEWEIDGDATTYSLSVTGDTSKTPPIYPVYIYPSGVDYHLDDSNPSGTLPGIHTGDANINVSQGITSLKKWKTSATASDCYNSNYSICLHTGDLTVSGAIGTGILMVEGNLTLEQTIWDGLILVTGHLLMEGGGGLGVTINGAVLVNNKIWINTGANPGNITIVYNRTEIDNALRSLPLRLLMWEDISMMP